jgi:sialic acid synthase SpsE
MFQESANNSYIIAEIGVNHNGSMLRAKKMIDVAKSIGVDCVKFQSFYEGEVNGLWPKIKQYYFDIHNLRNLRHYCERQEIDFLCSAFGKKSLRALISVGCEVLKIPSGKIIDQNYLDYAAENFSKFILSTGMADNREIKNAVDTLGLLRTTVLHCVSAYPTPIEQVNLKAMLHIPGKSIGLSDHTLGTEISIAAVALGAEVIEKHLTLSRGMDGPDHHMSLEALEFMNLVSSIRNIEKAMGTGEKKCQESEKVNLFRRE